MTPYYERDGIMIFCGDCLEVMPRLADNSFGLIFADWPYYKVKGEAWDRQWADKDKFLAWIGQTLESVSRLLMPNGSFYGCASPEMATLVEVEIGKHFNVLNNIRWIHNGNTARRADRTQLRSYLSFWEAIIFAEHYGSDSYAKGEAGYITKCDELRGFVFEPLRAYLDGERRRAGLSDYEMRNYLGLSLKGGGLLSHFWGKSQWTLPTKEHYQKLQELFNQNCNGSGNLYLCREYDDLRREYDDLRKEYDDLRKEYDNLRREFTVSQHVPHTDMWEFATVKDYPGKHPTQKPLAMLEHIIAVSSKPEQVILDFVMGSGTTLVAAQNEGRQAVGIDTSEDYCRIAVDRLRQPSFFSIPSNGKVKTEAKQLEIDIK